MADSRPTDFKNITANGTTTIGGVTSYVRLHKVIVNKAGVTGNILQLYVGQSASGRLIATIDTTAVREIHFGGLPCNDGLTAVLGTGTAADVTILFE